MCMVCIKDATTIKSSISLQDESDHKTRYLIILVLKEVFMSFGNRAKFIFIIEVTKVILVQFLSLLVYQVSMFN